MNTATAMNTDRITLAEFITQHALTMSCVQTDHNPHMEDMGRDARHWNCLIEQEGQQMKVTFSQGSAHTQEPTLADVLGCLAMDAAGVENARGDFAEWCSEYAYDEDSRKAERTFDACKSQSESLKALLGPEAFEQLLWNTEQE